MKTLYLLLLFISLFSCAEQAEEEVSFSFSYELENYPNIGNTLYVPIRLTDYNKDFSHLTLYKNNCSEINKLTSFNSAQLRSMRYFGINDLNTSTDIFYDIKNGGETLTSCKRYMVYTHDNVPPTGSLSLPSSITNLDGQVLGDKSIMINIPNGYFSSELHSINLYNDISCTQYIGNISSSGTLDLLDNTTNTIFYKVVDEAGNEGNVVDPNISIIVDGTAPTPPILLGGLTHTQNQNPTLTGQASADTSIIEITVNGNSSNITKSVFESGFSVSLNNNSSNTILINASDIYGNKSQNIPYIINHDTVAPTNPVFNSTTLANTAIILNTSNVFVQTDEDSDISRILVYDDSGLTNLIDNDTKYNYDLGKQLVLNNLNGPNTYYFIAEDKAGNRSSAVNLVFNVDTTPPTPPNLDSSLSSLNGGFTNQSSHLYFGTVTPDTVSVEVLINSSSSILTRQQFIDGINIPYIINSANTLSFSALDSAGNTSTPTVINLTHDNVAPSLGVLGLTDNTVKFNGIIKLKCEEGIDYTVSSPINITNTCSGGSFTITNTESSEGSTFSLTYTQSDSAGNIGNFNQVFTVDNTPPIITVDPHDALTNDINFNLQGDCESPGYVFFTGDDTNVTQCINDRYLVSLNLSGNGVRNINIEHSDLAGNSSTTSTSFTLDTTPPELPLLLSSLLNRNGTVTDDLSIILEGTQEESLDVEYSINDGPWNIVPYASFTSGYSINLITTSKNSIKYRSKDNANNYSYIGLLEITHVTSVSPQYSISAESLISSADLGVNIRSRKNIKVKNTSVDINTGLGVELPSLSVVSPTTEIEILPSSECLNNVIPFNYECELKLEFQYTTTGIKDHDITFEFPDTTTFNTRVYRNKVTSLAITTSGIFNPSSLTPSDPKYYLPHLKLDNDYYRYFTNSSTKYHSRDLTILYNSGIKACEVGQYTASINFSTNELNIYDRNNLASPMQTIMVDPVDINESFFNCYEAYGYSFFATTSDIAIINKDNDDITHLNINTNGLPLESLESIFEGGVEEYGNLIYFIGEKVKFSGAAEYGLYSLNLSNGQFTEYPLPSDKTISLDSFFAKYSDSLGLFLTNLASEVEYYDFDLTTFQYTLIDAGGVDLQKLTKIGVKSVERDLDKFVNFGDTRATINNGVLNFYNFDGTLESTYTSTLTSINYLGKDGDLYYFYGTNASLNIEFFTIDSKNGSGSTLSFSPPDFLNVAYFNGHFYYTRSSTNSIHIYGIEEASLEEFIVPTTLNGARYEDFYVTDLYILFIYIGSDNTIGTYYTNKYSPTPIPYILDVSTTYNYAPGYIVSKGRLYVTRSSTNAEIWGFPLVIEE